MSAENSKWAWPDEETYFWDWIHSIDLDKIDDQDCDEEEEKV